MKSSLKQRSARINSSGGMHLKLASCLLLLAGNAVAQEALQEAPIEEVVVTGSRNLLGQALLIDTRTKTVSRDTQISLNRTAGDWIERLPGVSLNGQGGLFQSYSVRGFSRWRIRTEVAGVPLFTDRRAGNAASFIPPELLGQVGVSRGPGSTLYGSDAMGGVVNLALASTDVARATADWSDLDQATGLALVGPLAAGVGGGIALRRADNAADGSGQPLNTRYEQGAGFLDIRTGWQGLESHLIALASKGQDIGKSNRGFPDTLRADYPEETHSLVAMTLRNPGVWLGRLYGHSQDWTSSTEQIAIRRNDTRYRSDTLGGLLFHALDVGSSTGRVGVEWLGRRNVNITDREFDPADDLIFSREVLTGAQDNVGLFVDQQWTAGPWRLGAGLRWDHVEQTGNRQRRSDSAANASLSADWQINDSWVLQSRWGTGFRFPTLSERYFDGVTPRGDTLGNPDLAPEKNRGVELGLNVDMRGISATVSVYRNQLDDYIERVRINSALRTFRNLDSATIEGIEASLTWQASPGWQHQLSYQWQQGEDATGNWLADLHPVEWRYLTRWETADVSVSLDVVHRQARGEAGPGELAMASATLAGGGVDWRINPDWTLGLAANNLFDTRWVASADEAAAFQPGRTLTLRLTWQEG
ncbi:MAG: TonB-dependent receptor [Halieaceae bacterium]|nr:TonB-dependent receptor [Halieaceae bacterium]